MANEIRFWQEHEITTLKIPHINEVTSNEHVHNIKELAIDLHTLTFNSNKKLVFRVIHSKTCI